MPLLEELTDAFTAWAAQVLLPRRMRGTASAPLPTLEEVRTMLAETVQEWTEQWVAQGSSRANARCCGAPGKLAKDGR